MSYTNTHVMRLKDGKSLGDRLKADYDTKTAIIQANNPGAHNALYREKNLGSSFTSAQSATITAGAFEDIYPGDYWSFSNVSYSYTDVDGTTKSDKYTGTMRVADLDYFLHCGDTQLATHHIVVIPDGSLYTGNMNDTNSTEGGYVSSKIRTKGLKRAEAIFKACFGSSHIITHRDIFVNGVTNGRPTSSVWCDSTVELLNEMMLYGSCIYESGSPDGTTTYERKHIGNSQLAVFRHRHNLIANRGMVLMRDVVNTTCFSQEDWTGMCSQRGASGVGAVVAYALVA